MWGATAVHLNIFEPLLSTSVLSLLLLFGVVFFWSHCFFAVAIVKSDRTNTHEDGKPESQAQFFQVKWTWIITKANGTVLRLILVTGKEPLKHFDL